MVAEVDILTGKRAFFHLLKPVLRAKSVAMTDADETWILYGGDELFAG